MLSRIQYILSVQEGQISETNRIGKNCLTLFRHFFFKQRLPFAVLKVKKSEGGTLEQLQMFQGLPNDPQKLQKTIV